MAILEMMMPSYGVAFAGPAFVNVGALGSSGNAITLGQPASPAANDIWIMVVQTSNQSITTPTNATAGTWAQIATQTGLGTAANALATRLGFFWHRWTTTTGNVTVADSGDHQIARIAAYRGCKTTGNPWTDVNAMEALTTDGSGNCNVTGITTTVANALVLVAAASSRDIADTPTFSLTGVGTLTSGAERIDNSLATGTGGAIMLWEGQQATTGATGTLTLNAGASVNVIGCLVALQPP